MSSHVNCTCLSAGRSHAHAHSHANSYYRAPSTSLSPRPLKDHAWELWRVASDSDRGALGDAELKTSREALQAALLQLDERSGLLRRAPRFNNSCPPSSLLRTSRGTLSLMVATPTSMRGPVRLLCAPPSWSWTREVRLSRQPARPQALMPGCPRASRAASFLCSGW